GGRVSTLSLAWRVLCLLPCAPIVSEDTPECVCSEGAFGGGRVRWIARTALQWPWGSSRGQ
ncbi:hypothetical protein NDU88_004156, partial [Pleurodeles waltl]